MSITSISRLQHRRGLKTDLPANLYEGELGWCIDTRELFIGNGPTTNGNSQILSQWSPNTQLITHTYVGSSGITATTSANVDVPTTRTIGAKFDDWVSVKDYGAAGDGVTDDTAAIQRAINDRWATRSPAPNDLSSMSCIRFPAGRYLVSSSILVLPMVALVGEGSSRSVIAMAKNANATPCVIRTADSFGQSGVNIGLSSAALPNNILIQGLGIDASAISTLDGIWLQRASMVQISDVAVTGAWVSGQNPIASNTYATNGILIQTLGSLNLSNNIVIRDYTATGFAHGIYANDSSRYITVDGFDINGCFVGALFDTNSAVVATNGASYVRITNGSFRNIDWYGLSVASSNPGITSSNNAYDTVGDVYNAPPIMFGPLTNGCASINDVFSVQDRERIEIGNPVANLFISPQQVSIASNAPTPIGPLTLVDNTALASAGISYPTSVYNTVFLQYSVARGTGYRAGKITMITDGTSVALEDEGVDLITGNNVSVGVTWSANVTSGTVNLNYTTTSTGTNGNLYCIETTWQSM